MEKDKGPFGVYDESFDLDSDGELNAVEFDYMMDEYEKAGSDSDLEDDDSYLDYDDEDEDDFEDDDFEDDNDWDDDEDDEDDDDDWDDESDDNIY